MSKRLYLLILFAVTLFCGCKNSNPLDSTTKVSFSIPARVLEDVGNNNGEDILVCTQVLRGPKVIIDEKYERTLFFDENNKPCIESIVLENIPLYTSLVLKMQIFVGEELFAEGQSEKTLFTEGKNTLNLQLKLIPKDDDEDDDPEPEDPADPEIELKINQTSIAVEEWEESVTFTATEGFDSYNWTCGDQTGTTKEFVVDISKLNVAEYEVTVTATKGTKTYSATSKLIVKANSNVLNINQAEVVVEEWEESATFTATTDFDSYKWSCGDQTSDTSSFTINVSDLSVGEYEVTVVATKGTKTYSATSKLIVEANANVLKINQAEVVVEEWEESVTFTATTGFESYKWSCGDQTSDTNSFTINVSGLSVGEYEVTVTATKGTKTYTVTAILKVQTLSDELKIIEKNVTVEEWEESATFTATTGFDSYKWSCGDQTSDTSSFTINVSDLSVGEYEVTVVATKGTKTYSATSKLIVEANANVLKINQAEVVVEEWEESATFTATTGFESYSWSCGDQTSDANSFTINVSDLSVGEYEVTVVATKGTKTYSATSKLIVKANANVLKINQAEVVVEEWEESVTFTATEGFDSYNWSCGEQTSDTNSFTINVSDLSVGEYEVTVTATKGTKTYTAETSKLIVKEISKPLEISRIILSEDESLSIAKFTATEGFSDFSWSCADQRGCESEFTVDLSKLSVGEHKVNLTATKGTKTYTAETTFKVEAMINFGEITQSEVNIINESKEIINGYEKLIFKASEGFDSYTWRYANKTVIGDSIEIDTSVLPLGKYVLQLLAVKNGIEYSAQVEFEIQNKISSIILIKDFVISIVDEDEDDDFITLSVPEGYDSYEWRCQNLTSDVNTFTINWNDLIDYEGYTNVLVNVIAVKNGVEYSAEITL